MIPIVKKILNNSFIKKISIYFVGTLSSNLINVFLLPLYAYFVSAENLGEYDYILSVANMAVPIVFLCIWESALKFGIKNHHENEIVFSNMVLLQIVLSVIGIVIFVIVDMFHITSISLPVTVLFVLSQGWAQLWQYSVRAYGENRLYVWAGIAGSITVIVVDVIFILIGNLNWIGLSVSHICSQFLIWLILEIKLHILLKWKIGLASAVWIKKILAFSVPLVVNNVALWFYSGGIRLVIRNFLGATETGMYSFASKFSVLISLCGSAVSMAFIEEVYHFRDLDEYKRKTSRMIEVISKAYFSIVLLAIPAIYILYSLAFKNTEYFLSSNYVFALLLSSLFTALSNSYGSAFQVSDSKYIALTTVAGGLAAVVLSLILIDYLGIYAILIAGIVGPFTMMLLRALYAWIRMRVRVNWMYNIFILTISTIMAFILSKYRNLLLQITIFVVASALCTLFYKKEIISLMGGKKK